MDLKAILYKFFKSLCCPVASRRRVFVFILIDLLLNCIKKKDGYQASHRINESHSRSEGDGAEAPECDSADFEAGLVVIGKDSNLPEHKLDGLSRSVFSEIVVIHDNEGKGEAKLYLYKGESDGFEAGAGSGVQSVEQILSSLKSDVVVFAYEIQAFELESIVSLYKEFEKQNFRGVVFPKIIGSSNKLLDAGGIISSKGSVQRYGYGDLPFKPEYCFSRLTASSSEFCFMTSKKDLASRNICYPRLESWRTSVVDFCFELGTRGAPVKFCGNSVFHSSIDISSLSEELNKEFYNKWGHVFRQNKKTPDKRYSPFVSNKNILVIDDLAPNPSLGYGYPRAHNLLTVLAHQPLNVSFIPTLNHCFDPEVTEYFQGLGVEMFYSVKNRNDLQIKAILNERRRVYDYALISRPHNMSALYKYIKKMNPKCKIIYDAEALFSYRHITYVQNVLKKEVSEKHTERMIRNELKNLIKADSVFTVSERERNIMAKFGVKNAEVVSHPVDIRSSGTGFSTRKGMLFVGAIHEPDCPNEDALLYFLHEIYPLIRSDMKDPVNIIGVCNSSKVREFESDQIRILGRVKDLNSYYDSCRIFIAPTRYAAGIPLKVAEAASHGLPVILTPLLAEQLGWRDGIEAMVGETPQSFAEKSIRLYNEEELWKNIQISAWDVLKRDFSRKQFEHRVRKAFNRLWK